MNSTTTSPDQFFGYDVMDSAGNRIGSVDNVWVDDATNELEFVGVKTGWLIGKTHVIPTADAQIGDNTITVPYTEDQVKNAPSFSGDDELSPDDEDEIYGYYGLDRSTAPSPTGLASGETDNTASGYDASGTTDGYTGSASGIDSAGETLNDGGEINVPVSEEQLQVGKREVQEGTVRLRKVVRTEHQEVPVELRREDVEIERVPVSDATEVPDTAFQERDIEVPVSREEAVVGKQAQVTGQVRVQKNVSTETQTVGDDVRREEVDVDDSANDDDGTSTGF